MTEAYLKPLPIGLREKAVRELNETVEVQVEAVTELRRDILSQCAGLCGSTDTAYLVRFLRPKKYVVHKALALYKNYHKIRLAHPEIFEDLHPRDVQDVWRSCFVGGLPSRDRQGRQIMVVSPQNWKPNDISLKDALRSLVCQLEYLISDEETQINGIVLIADFSKFSFEQAKALRPSYIQLLINLIQNAFPARFKEVFVLNQPWTFNVVMALFRPFLSDKMKKRILLLGDDLSRLQDHIAPEVLPVEFGGTRSHYSGQEWAAIVTGWYEQSANCSSDEEPLEKLSSCNTLLCSGRKSSEVESVCTEVIGNCWRLGSNSSYANRDADSNGDDDDDCGSDKFFDCENDFVDSAPKQLLLPNNTAPVTKPSVVGLKIETTV